jgi:hypothetical protein
VNVTTKPVGLMPKRAGWSVAARRTISCILPLLCQSLKHSPLAGRLQNDGLTEYREGNNWRFPVATQRYVERGQQSSLVDIVRPASLANRDLARQRAAQERVLERSKAKSSKHLGQFRRRIDNWPRLVFRTNRDRTGCVYLARPMTLPLTLTEAGRTCY